MEQFTKKLPLVGAMSAFNRGMVVGAAAGIAAAGLSVTVAGWANWVAAKVAAFTGRP